MKPAIRDALATTNGNVFTSVSRSTITVSKPKNNSSTQLTMFVVKGKNDIIVLSRILRYVKAQECSIRSRLRLRRRKLSVDEAQGRTAGTSKSLTVVRGADLDGETAGDCEFGAKKEQELDRRAGGGADNLDAWCRGLEPLGQRHNGAATGEREGGGRSIIKDSEASDGVLEGVQIC